MKVRMKKVFVFTLILIIFYSITSILPTYASSSGLDFSQADKFIQKGKSKQGIQDLDEIGASFSDIGTVLVYIGAGILVAGMGYIGIMYMISAPEKRGKLKQQLIGLVVAGIVIFGAYSIWAVLIKILSGAIDN